jgi:2-(1,2-epoxy-1,2-dihydrophenyl)acetyl-CoA isomerase
VRVLVLTGEGSSFCPGADLAHFSSGEADERLLPRHFRVASLLHDLPAVTIAAVNGACAGAGFGWALACDLRLASASARFNVAFLDVGVAGDMGIPWTLSRIVGAAKARELCFLPSKFGADEALRLGIVNRVVEADELASEVEAAVARLLLTPPGALWALKSNFLMAERLSMADYVDVESERHLRVASSSDTAEGFRAFMEKRPPRYTGG